MKRPLGPFAVCFDVSKIMHTPQLNNPTFEYQGYLVFVILSQMLFFYE